MKPATDRPIPFRAIVASGLLALLPGAAGAQPPLGGPAGLAGRAADAGAALGPALMIDDGLTPRPVRLVSITAGQITYLDERNRRRQAALDSVLAILPQWSEARGAPPVDPSIADDDGPAAGPALAPLGASNAGLIALVDGQRFPGDLARSSTKPDDVAWTHAVLGGLSVPLDRVAWFIRPGPVVRWSPPERAPVKDELLLANGDRLAGFIASIGDPVRIETEAGVTDLPVDRVRGAEFANPRAPGRGLRLWLSDGTVASISRVELGPDRRFSLQLTESGATGSYEWGSVRALVTDAGRLRALSSIEPVSQGPTGARRFAPPVERLRAGSAGAADAAHAAAALDADDLLLPGPMTVSWQLPAGARRLAAQASLMPGAAPWGDCEISIAVDGAEVWRKRLSAEQPSLPLSVDLPGASMTITVDAGRLGPVRDQVILVRPLVLLGPSR